MKITFHATLDIQNDIVDNVVHHLTEKLRRSEQKLSQAMGGSGQSNLTSQEVFDMDPLAALTAQVDATVGAEASAVVLIGGLRQKLIDAGTNPTKLKALADSLQASQTALAAAVAANDNPANPPGPGGPGPFPPAPMVGTSPRP